MIRDIRVTEREQKTISGVLTEVQRVHQTLDENNVLESAPVFAADLPRRIRKIIYEFKLRESSPCVHIINNPILPNHIGPTPTAHWRQGEYRPLNRAQILHSLYSSLLGEPFGFDSQQRGRIFNDLISIPGAPANSSSGQGRIGLHTEDYSHTQPFMPDYLGLMSLRNESNARTTISSLENVALPTNVLRILFEHPFPYTNALNQTVLFGDIALPYLRYGSVDTQRCTSEMRTALHLLSTALQQHQQEIILKQGDCLYLDNFVAVHGRSCFDVRFDANGRWFSRLCIIKDLRRIRSYKVSPESRIFVKDRTESHNVS